MPFSFLNPLIWLGALAVAAPLWLHLRRKRETHLQKFSALRFLDDQPTPRRSPWRLRNLALLVMRLLALLLLLAAFAWPYLRGASTVAIRESRVYILDNTLSRQANDGFLNDRERVLQELSHAGADLQVAVIELTSAPRVVMGFSDDRPSARERLHALQPSFQRGSYLAAFRQANALLENSLGNKKRIVFLGDNQENQWNENVSTPPFLRNVEVELAKSPGTSLPNLSLSEPRVQRIFLGDKSLINFTVKLNHAGPASAANVEFRANGQALFNRAVDLKQQPESILLQAQWEADPRNWLRGEATVDGSPDGLRADNQVFFSLAPVSEGKVAVLAQSSYLRLALSPEIMRGQWAARFLDPANLAAESAANQDADVLCLESGFLQSSEARKLLWRYLTNGRGALLLVNRLTPSIDACLRELGFQPDGPLQISDDSPEKFQFVFFNHPIFHPFLSPDYGNLMEIKFTKGFHLQSAQATPLAFSEHGAGLFFQGTKFPGKLFVAAFSMDREHTSWPVHQSFIPFLDLTLQAARAEDPAPNSFEPGESCAFRPPSGTSSREVVLSDDRNELARFPIEQGRAQVRMPDRPGLYNIGFDSRPTPDKIVSVNPSPKESELTYVAAPVPLKNWQFNLPPGEPGRRATSAGGPVRLSGILQQRLWWWMLLGGLAALAMEMVFAEARKETR